MRVAIIGQQAFGGAVVEAFVAKGHIVAAAFVPPQAAGARPDPLRAAAEQRGIRVFDFARYTMPEAQAALRDLEVDLGIMAYVVAFVPQAFCAIPKFGTIQFHPSLLPEHRGPSSINWAIIQGRRRTGLSIFRPVDGLDEGPLVLQKEIEIGPDETLGAVYFDKIFPLGIAALVEAAELVASGRAVERAQPEEGATYEGWVREAEARIHWTTHVDQIYDLIRGCNPAPAAWTTLDGKKLQIFDCRKRIARTFGEIRGMALGEIVAVDAARFTISGQGGFIDVLRCRLGDGPKIAAGEAGLQPGMRLG
jgi:methionyl-tRNA formyltransferase